MTPGDLPTGWTDQLAEAIGGPVHLGDTAPLVAAGDAVTALHLEEFIRRFNPDYRHQSDEQLAVLTARDAAYYCGFDL